MSELDDQQLLAEFARSGSEAAFQELVSRHAGLVYSTAFRFCNNTNHAEEIAQAVFIILARKAETISPRVVLSGWLYQTTRLTAANFVKREIRRRRREQEAVMQSDLNNIEPPGWETISPLLDEAMGTLGESDRNAVLLRYFENRTSPEIGAALRMTEETARKRVNRAVEKLRRFLTKRGVTISSSTLSSAISAHSIHPVSAVMIKSLSVVAVAKGATASISTSTLIKGALKVMAWTKAKTAVVVGTILFLTTGTTTMVIKNVQAHQAYLDSWRVPNLNSAIVDKAPPQVRILPTKFRRGQNTIAESNDGTKWGGINMPISVIAWIAYEWRPARVIFHTEPQRGGFDFIASLPQGSYQALQRELKNTLGWVGRPEIREADVLVLRVRSPNASGLKPPIPGGQNDWTGEASYTCDDRALSSDSPPYLGLTRCLEQIFETPVIDQTGLTQHFSINLKWVAKPTRDAYLNAVKQALVDQLGLELVPDHEPIEMLVMETVK